MAKNGTNGSNGNGNGSAGKPRQKPTNGHPEKPKGLKPGDKGEDGKFLPGNSQAFQPGNEFGKLGGRPKKRSYAKLYEEEASRLCKNVTWSVALCNRLGLDPEKTTVDQLMVHSDMYNRATGKAEFARLALDRCEGKVPDTLLHADAGASLEEVRAAIAKNTGVPLDLLNALEPGEN